MSNFILTNTDDFNSWLDAATQKEIAYRRKLLAAVGLNGVNYIRSHWSPVSPSAPGSTPAEVTGALSESIGYELGEYQVILTASEIYAEYLEFGTINMAARPFFELAIQYLRDKFPEFVAEVSFG